MKVLNVLKISFIPIFLFFTRSTIICSEKGHSFYHTGLLSENLLLKLDNYSLIKSDRNDGTDPFNPINKIFARNNFFMDWEEFKDDRFYNITSTGGIFSSSENNLTFAFEIPYVITDVTFRTTSGLGDINFTSDYIVKNDLSKSFLFGFDLILPTASKKELGFGKFILAPAAGINFYTNFGFIGVIIKNYYSIAGNKSRKVVNELSFQPLVKINLGKRWFTVIKPDIRQNWATKRIFLPYTQEFGKMLNRYWIVSFTLGGHILNRDKRYDWNTSINISYLFNK